MASLYVSVRIVFQVLVKSKGSTPTPGKSYGNKINYAQE